MRLNLFHLPRFKAFTLIELMIVIAILGVLAAMVSGNFITSLKKGRDARRKADLEQIQRALEMYYEDNKNYPTTLEFGGQLCHPNGCDTKIYMQKVPNDPISGKNYGYESASGTDYRLYACLENNQQILPYNSLTGLPPISCNVQCWKQDQSGTTTCYWAISSPNTTP
jgi:type II secretion system protein G